MYLVQVVAAPAPASKKIRLAFPAVASKNFTQAPAALSADRTGPATPAIVIGDDSEIPAWAAAKWASQVLPSLYHRLVSSDSPFLDFSVDGKLVQNIQTVLDAVYPGHAWTVRLGDPIFRKAHQRVIEYRGKAGKLTLDAVDKFFANMERNTPVDIANYVRWALPNGPALFGKPIPEAHQSPDDPLYLPPEDIFESKFILVSLASFLKPLRQSVFGDRLGHPVGGLALIAAGVERAFTAYNSGIKISPGKFSHSKLGNFIVDEYMFSVQRLSQRRWTSILYKCNVQLNRADERHQPLQTTEYTLGATGITGRQMAQYLAIHPQQVSKQNTHKKPHTPFSDPHFSSIHRLSLACDRLIVVRGDDVGVLRSIAMNLTFPERGVQVTPYNIAYLQELVRNGPTTYPGARYVVRDTGERIDLRYNKRADAFLQVLAKLRTNTIPLPPSFLFPHLHPHPRAPGTVLPSTSSAPMFSFAFFPVLAYSALLAVFGFISVRIAKWRQWTLARPTAALALEGEEDDDGVELLPTNTSTLSSHFKNLPIPPPLPSSPVPVHHARTRSFSNDQPGQPPVHDLRTAEIALAKELLTSRIGIGDTIADKGTMSYITETIASRKANVAKIIEDATHDRLKPAPGMTIRESFESLVERELNLARDKSGQYAQKNLKEDNNVKQMVVAGSKGSFINISQMSVCVGQQSVEGRRIPFGFRHRTLPHFTKDDFSPESRGFVENSYLRGLTPQEFFFHAMAGREGLIDTAVKTAETGYIQRRLVQALEDVMVHYDNTVRNSLGDLIQFVYGEDGMDGAFIEKQSIDTFSLNDREFEHNYRVDVTDPAGGFLPGVLQVGIDDSSLELQKKLDEEYDQLVSDRRMLCKFIFPQTDTASNQYLPVNLSRIVQNATQIFHIDRRKPSDLEPVFIIDSVKALCDRLIVVRGDDRLSQEAQENATLRFQMHLRATFGCRRVLERFHLNKEAFEWVLGEVEAKFNQSLANPGEMCGTLAAQSIGEPATQMTLNTFHYAGVSSKNVTLGVPRLKEIINVATNIKTPSLSVYLEPGLQFDANLAKNVQQELAYTTLRTVTAAVEIWYDPDPTSTIIEEDEVFVEVETSSAVSLATSSRARQGSLMAITRHGINRADTGALMRCSFEGTVEILMEVAAVGEKDDCQGVAENVMFGQMAPMGTGAFDVALDIDMLKDAIVDHRLPVQSMLAAQVDGGMTPAQFTQCLFPNLAPICPSVSVQYRRHFSHVRRDVTLLRSEPQCYLPHLFTYFACIQSNIACVLADKPKIFAYIAFVLTDIPPLQSAIAIVQSYVASLFPNKSVVQPCVPAVSCATVSVIPAIFAYIAHGFADLSDLSEIPSRITCIQPNFAILVSLEPVTKQQRASQSFVPIILIPVLRLPDFAISISLKPVTKWRCALQSFVPIVFIPASRLPDFAIPISLEPSPNSNARRSHLYQLSPSWDGYAFGVYILPSSSATPMLATRPTPNHCIASKASRTGWERGLSASPSIKRCQCTPKVEQNEPDVGDEMRQRSVLGLKGGSARLRYLGMKANGRLLLETVQQDFPTGHSNLIRAPADGRLHAFTMGLTKELRLMEMPVMDRFTRIILPNERTEIQRIVKLMFDLGVQYSRSSALRDNRSETPALHLGIWEKYARVPRMTGETSQLQNPAVCSLIQNLLTLLATKVAPRMSGILRSLYPAVWRRQQRIYARVSSSLTVDKPWLDFGGAFFAVAVKIGSSEVDHLDWTDDVKGLTWVSGVGDWVGADLRAIETGYQFPLQAGDALAGNMRLVVHSASPVVSGERITLTFFTCSVLAKHSLGEEY
ncbi:hypothetical protein D9757_013779 [Collybiopsis confluens]|uniref:DNA-directed RNA polymerase n=1 Tax=Collybiopsis confluens TaxID=2823264 RepID=A0A8H5GID8_9AGAR|nr:hypothetical protein D9757_013779 [Collybiopsis confluens]